MRFCVPIPCFYPSVPAEDALRAIAAHGYDAAETYQWDTMNFDAVKNAIAETGVELLSMCTTSFDMTEPEKRNEWLTGLAESAAAAKKLGVGRLITQVGNDTGKERAYQHESIVKALHAAKPILEESGVTIMIEPLNTLVDHKGYYLWSAVEGFEIVREVGHPLVKVVYDIYHQQIMEGNIIPNITKNLDCIAHLHAAGHPGRIELQLGESDYRNIFRAVDAAGYTGACGLEYHPTLGADESLESVKALYR